LDEILERLLSQVAGDSGLRWFQGLRRAVATLADSPQRCALAPENMVFPFEVRHLLYGRKPHVYRIIFTTEGNTVFVLHVRHGRRQPIAKQ
jgi:plasmid stabilization system protein ParE